MRGRRLLALFLVAAAIVVAGVGAQFAHDSARSTFSATASATATPLPARDVAVVPSPQSHQTSLFGLRGARATWLERLLGPGAAILAGALLLAATQRRRALLGATERSPLGHGAVPLGRGPPLLAAI